MNMQSQADMYRSIRNNRPFVPANVAWRQAAETLETDRWANSVGFVWGDRYGLRYAAWQESDYHLVACFVLDEDGWCISGIDDIGRFSNRWHPGAIAHEHGNNRTFDWFHPADPDMAQWCYKRACSYGHYWDYRILVVTAHRRGIELARESLCGIESDRDESFLTGTVFDLKQEAIDMADETLRHLCGCQ